VLTVTLQGVESAVYDCRVVTCRSVVRRGSTGTVQARPELSRSLPADIFHLPHCSHISSCNLSELEGAYVCQPSCDYTLKFKIVILTPDMELGHTL